MKRYLLALDQGTTSSRAILFDADHNMISTAQRELTQYYPHSGWVEQDAMEIWSAQYAVMTEVINRSGIDPHEIAAIGITNQRETTVLWDRQTGRPVCRAIVWQCRRTAPYIDTLISRGLGETIHQVTGLIPDAYFSATKIQWIFDHIPGVREKAQKGDVLFGTVDTWLIWKLTEGRVHAPDFTNASRTMLFNIHTLDWDDRLLHTFSSPKTCLPEVHPSMHLFGRTSLLGAEIPITGVAGDQQAALFGHGCFGEGGIKNTYGTGCFLLLNTGTTPIESQNGLLTTIACAADGTVQYALEGSAFSGGSVVQWLRDELHFIDKSADSEALARSVDSAGGVYVVPAFTGIGAPYWDMYARGCIVGLTRGVGRAEIVRAALESIAYQIADLMAAMENDTDLSIAQLNVDGGASANNFLMQFQADILGKTVSRPPLQETTALGAAFLAGLYAEVWQNAQALSAHINAAQQHFTPQMAAGQRQTLLQGWHRAIERSRNWIEP